MNSFGNSNIYTCFPNIYTICHWTNIPHIHLSPCSKMKQYCLRRYISQNFISKIKYYASVLRIRKASLAILSCQHLIIINLYFLCHLATNMYGINISSIRANPSTVTYDFPYIYEIVECSSSYFVYYYFVLLVSLFWLLRFSYQYQSHYGQVYLHIFKISLKNSTWYSLFRNKQGVVLYIPFWLKTLLKS